MKNTLERRPQSGASWPALGLSIVNGVVGNYLRQTANGLDIPMAFYHRNTPQPLEKAHLAHAYPKPSKKLSILVHGLCTNENIWSIPDGEHELGSRTYGSLLKRDFGYEPFYPRYNTGLHISENGQSLAGLMDKLLSNYPAEVEEIVMIGHSMGGMVMRSACHYAVNNGLAWVSKVKRMFYIGSPHLGSYFEKFGNLMSTLLKAIPHTIPLVIAGVIDVRSDGIKDLRFGNITDEDWMGHDPDACLQNTRQAVPWLSHAEHYLIAGTLTKNPDHPVTLAMGDLLVRIPSAFVHGDADFPGIDPEHIRLFPGIKHLALAGHPEVYGQIKRWCGQVEMIQQVEIIRGPESVS